MSHAWGDGGEDGRSGALVEALLGRGVNILDPGYNAGSDPDGLQAAVSDLTSANPILFLPPGAYSPRHGLTSNLNNLDIWTLGGIGQSALLGLGATVINVPPGEVGFTFGDGTVTRFQGPTLRGIHFRDITGTANGAVWARRVNNGLLDRVATSGAFAGGAAILNDGTGNVNQYWKLRDCAIHNARVALRQVLCNGTEIDGGYWDGNNNAGSLSAGSVGIQHASGDTIRVKNLRVQFYDTQIDLQAGEGHEVTGGRFEGFGIAIQNAGLGTNVRGGTFENAILGGGVGIAMNNLAGAQVLEFFPGYIGSVATKLADARTDTTSLIDRVLRLPQDGIIALGDAQLIRRGAGNIGFDGNLYANLSVVVDAADTGAPLLFGILQDTKLYRAGVNQLATDGSFRFGATAPAGATLRAGTGSPEGVVTGKIGDLFTRTNGGVGTTLYVKESGSGNTGWVAK